MVEHIVCFKFKPETTEEQIDTLIRRLQALKEAIPTVVDLTAGKTFTPERGQGYSAALVVRFNDKAGLNFYQPHPKHVAVKEYIAEICESTLAIDYEF